jgi:ribosomal protein S15P/S13E
MNPDAEHPEPGSTKDETLARHQRMAKVLDGKRRMDWSDWAMVIYESQCLTPDGRRVALQAVDTLQHTLRDDFLRRVEDWLARMRATGDPDLAPDVHPIFSLGLWPVNDVPWVYANLIRLAAHIQLFKLDNHNRSRRNLDNNRVRRVLKTLRENPEPINWVSALLQLEEAGLGLRAG